MTEEQAWVIFVIEPIIFVLMMFIVIYAYDKLYPCPNKEKRDSTGRTPSMPHGDKTEPFKPKSHAWRRSQDMLDENSEE